MWPLSLSVNLPAAAITRYSRMTLGLVIYLCLWKTITKILVALVSFIHIIQEW